jgi:hypothetical protein
MSTLATTNLARAFVPIQYPLNTRVKLSDSGRKRWKNATANPHYTEGFIYKFAFGDHVNEPNTESLSVLVTWDNGLNNGYHMSDLDIMDVPLKKGDLVAMSATGRKRYPGDLSNNPHDMLGKIVNGSKDRVCTDNIQVRWDNGQRNEYTAIELMPVKQASGSRRPKNLSKDSIKIKY